MGSKDIASPNAPFILTRMYFFILSFMSIYILLSTYSNNGNLNLCLLNKYLLGGIFFKIFKIVKRVFLCYFYVRDNRVFPTVGSLPTSLKFAQPGKILLLVGFLIKFLFPPTKNLSPPQNNNFQVIIQQKLYF